MTKRKDHARTWSPLKSGSADDIRWTGSLAYIGPEIPEDAPPIVPEGIARRRMTVLHGQCPCGAVPQWPNRKQRRASKARASARVQIVFATHESDCPAIAPEVLALVGGGR